MVLKVGYSLRNTQKEKDEYIDSINDTINKFILGSKHSSINFEVPLTNEWTDIASNISLSDM